MKDTTHFDAVIVGAGFSGMYMLHKLREQGVISAIGVSLLLAGLIKLLSPWLDADTIAPLPGRQSFGPNRCGLQQVPAFPA